MKNYSLLLIIVFLCFTNCNKEDKNENLYFSDTLISQVYSGNLAVHGFTYNSEYLIRESTEPFVYKKFTYDSRNLLKKVEMAYSFSSFSCVMIPGQSQETDPRKASISQYSEFEYNDSSLLTKKSNYFINNGNPQLTSFQTYEYLNGNIKKISTFNPQGLLTGYHDYNYDDRGNMIRDDQYSNNSGIKLVHTVTFDFDNKNNPYLVFACEGDPGKYTNRNNIVNEISVSYLYNGIPQSSVTRTNVYEYNSLDYPVKINELDCLYGK
jgi:hypothetical protein